MVCLCSPSFSLVMDGFLCCYWWCSRLVYHALHEMRQEIWCRDDWERTREFSRPGINKRSCLFVVSLVLKSRISFRQHFCYSLVYDDDAESNGLSGGDDLLHPLSFSHLSFSEGGLFLPWQTTLMMLLSLVQTRLDFLFLFDQEKDKRFVCCWAVEYIWCTSLSFPSRVLHQWVRMAGKQENREKERRISLWVRKERWMDEQEIQTNRQSKEKEKDQLLFFDWIRGRNQEKTEEIRTRTVR